MNAKQLLNYLREVQALGINLETLQVGVIGDVQGGDMTLLGIKRMSTNHTNVIAIDIGLQDGKEAAEGLPKPEPIIPAETQEQTDPACYAAIQKALYPT